MNEDWELKNDSREDQVYKCLVCDEDEVRWNGKDWKCSACGSITESP